MKMSYNHIIRLYETRKHKLLGLLSDQAVDIRPERALQIQGAVDEIDLFLLTLRQYREQAVHTNFQQPDSANGMLGFLTRMFRPRTQEPEQGAPQ